MRIVISSTGQTADDKVDMRFGRCRYFVLVETQDNRIVNISSFDNQGAIQGHGAGIKAAQQVGDLKPDAIITGNLGPKASDAISQLGIEVYQGSGRIEDAVIKLLEEKLEKLKEISEPHSGIAVNKKARDERVYFPLLENKYMLFFFCKEGRYIFSWSMLSWLRKQRAGIFSFCVSKSKDIGGSAFRLGKSVFLIAMKSDILRPISVAMDRIVRSLRFATANIRLISSIVKG